MIHSPRQGYSKLRMSPRLHGLIPLLLNKSVKILDVYPDFTLYIFVASA